MTKKLDNWKSLIAKIGLTKKNQFLKKMVNNHPNEWNWHIQKNIDMTIDVNWTSFLTTLVNN
jgi:hypothetical protein